VFINDEGELFSVIIATESAEIIDNITVTNDGVIATIEGKKYSSHPDDEVVMINQEGEPTFLLYPTRIIQ